MPLMARRPFWAPASNYYVLAVAIAIGFFFIVWGIMHDSGDDTPWVTAGVGSSILLIGAVILRELILRRARRGHIRHERHIRSVNPIIDSDRGSDKLTLERNAILVAEIKKKSEAAKVLGKFSAVHREVFELCDAYLNRNERELGVIAPGSPRLAALLRSRDSIRRHHRFHLLRWAELESHTLSQEARSKGSPGEKVSVTENAIDVIDNALHFYPAERSLLDTRDLLTEMIVSIEVSDCVEQAERAAFNGDLKLARANYRDALFHLGRDNVSNSGRDLAAERINAELEKLIEVEGNDR